MKTHPQQLRIDSARLWALRTPAVIFYGTLACNLSDVLDPTTDTAATNGRVIKWNPDFVARLSDEEVRFVLLHEVLHCAHGHFWRLPLNEDGNVAGDYVINAVLRDVAGIAMPKGGLYDKRFKGMAEEEVLAALASTPPPLPPPDGPGDAGDAGEAGTDSQPGTGTGKPDGKPDKVADRGGCGGFEAPAADKPTQPGSAAQAPTLRQEWDRAVVQAAQVAQSLAQGSMPAVAQRALDRVRAAAQPDWRAETADFVRSAIADRADWSRQARRMATAPVLYPRRRADQVGLVVFVRDTSGSVDSATVATFNAHIRDLIADIGCEALIIDADAAVQAEHRITAGDDVPDRAKGGGGTDFRPAFDRVAELAEEGERIAGVVYLTDLCGMFPSEAPDVPSLWASTIDGLTAPFGRTVRIKS